MPPQTHPLIARLQDLCRRADAEFERGRKVHGSRILCAAGCSSCCSQFFQITEPEAARISLHLATLPATEQQRLRERAREYLPQREALMPAEQWGATRTDGDLPCPALTDDGACSIYEVRPVMCRKFGVPIYNPDKPDRVMACELNFKPGEAIEDANLVENQIALYHAQQELQAEWNSAGGRRDPKPWNVGRALTEDASGLLP